MTFAFGPITVGALPAGHYLVAGDIGTSRPSPDQPAAAWMREWSLPSSPGRPAFVRAQGLDTLADILESAASRPRTDAGFTFQVEIKD
jgi:hypothetical protein